MLGVNDSRSARCGQGGGRGTDPARPRSSAARQAAAAKAAAGRQVRQAPGIARPPSLEKTKVTVDIVTLRSRPEHLLTVARWIYEEWDHVTDKDLDPVVARTAARMNDDRVPLTLVALRGSECVGTVGLWESDLASRPDLYPWLAALYVHPAHRGCGVGGALIEALVATARRLGVRRLYLHTETASEYYRRKGWRFLFRTLNDRNEETEVYDLLLDA